MALWILFLFLCMAFCDRHFVTNVLSEWSCKAHFIRWPDLQCHVAGGRLFKLTYPLLVFILWGCDVKKWDSLIVCEKQATQFGASHWCMSNSPTAEALKEDDIHFKMMGPDKLLMFFCVRQRWKHPIHKTWFLSNNNCALEESCVFPLWKWFIPIGKSKGVLR